MTAPPANWAVATIGDVCLPVSKTDPVTTGRAQVAYVDIGSVDGERHTLGTVATVVAKDAPSRCRQVLRSGDTVFSTVRPYLEKIAHIGESLAGEFASTGFCVLRPGPSILPRFLYYYSLSRAMLEQVLVHQRGVSYPAVLDKDVRATSIPVPPLEEQRRIVDILEDHLSRLDAAERGLTTARLCLGALLASTRSCLREGPLRNLEDVAAIQGGIQKQPIRRPAANSFPFLRVANVTANGLNLTEVHRIELFGDELARLRLQLGDLLVVEGNGSISQIGRAALWDGSIEDCVHQNHLIRVRPGAELEPRYLEAIWNSPETRGELASVASSSSGLHTLSVAKLKALTIPVPSRERQVELLSVLEELGLERVRLMAALELALARSTNLRRSLLAAAFAGRLTTTVSNAVLDSVAPEKVLP